MSGRATRKRSPSLEGARVWVTGKRKGDAMARILEGHGAEATVVPTLETRENADPVWLARQAEEAAETGFTVAIFLTGIGGRLLFEAARENEVFDRLAGRLEKAVVVARGPKASSALRSAGIHIDEAPDDATGAGILRILREKHRERVEDEQVLLQRHGRPERRLEKGVREMGGRLTTLDLYRYAPPPDLPGVRRMLERCVDGELDAVVFTSPPAARGLLSTAEETGQADDLRRASREGLVVAAVGGSTERTLREGDVAVHVIPDDFTQPSLARALAQHWQDRA